MRFGTTALILGALVLGLATTSAHAHGGFYRGPSTPDGIPLDTTPGGGPGGGVPSTGGGPSTGMPTPGPAVTGRKRGRENGPETKPTGDLPAPLAPPAVRGAKWERWWELNKLRFLGLADDRLARSRTGEDVSPAPEIDVEPLLALLEDDSQDLRAAAALALGRLRAEQAPEALRSRLATEEHPQVRTSLVLSLLHFGEERDLLLFHSLVGDEDQPPLARYLAVLGVGVTGGPDAAAILEPLLAHRPGKRRAAAPALVATGYYALGWSGDPSATELLRQALAEKHHRPVIRSFAQLGLARLGDRESMESLSQTLLRDRDVSMRRSAALALGDLVRPDEEKYVARLLLSARMNGDPGARRLSALSLGDVHAPAVREGLRKSFGDAKDLDRPFFALAMALQGDLDAAPLLRDALEQDDFEESLQAGYCIALGILGDLGAAPRMEQEVGRLERQWSPGYAALGLAMMGSRRSIPAIRERLDRVEGDRLRNVLQVALGLLRDPETLAGLRTRVREGRSVYDRATAAVALGLVRDSGAVEDLTLTAASSTAPSLVRAAALGALGRIGSPDRPPRLTEFVAGHNVSIDLATVLHLADALNTR